jgi:DNA polymerase-3 subunit delta'
MIHTWHQTVWDQLVTTRNSNHLPHAILISGSEGTGKQVFAEALVDSLLCESPLDDYHACGHCKSCHVKHSNAHPDYVHVTIAEKKTQILIDQIRQLNEFLRLSRSYQGSRVAFINPAEALNINAANSLLKSLEEPADNSVIILLTSQLSTLLPTIKSRCQILHLATPRKEIGLQWLSQQSIQHSPEELLEMSGGRPLYALELDNKEHFERRNDFANDLSSVVMQRQSITEISKRWQNAVKHELLDWQIHWVQQLIKQCFSTTEQQSVLNLPRANDITRLWQLHDELIKFRAIAHTSLNAQLFIENMLLSWMKL